MTLLAHLTAYEGGFVLAVFLSGLISGYWLSAFRTRDEFNVERQNDAPRG